MLDASVLDEVGHSWPIVCLQDSMLMKLRVNGDPIKLDGPCNLDKLIEQLGLTGRRLAVELNGEIVPRSEYATRPLSDSDQVEIVQAIGGG